MSAEIRRLHLSVPFPHVPAHGRFAGLGSVFGKALRDDRVGMVVVTALLATMALAGGYNMSTTYGTAQTRAELQLMSETLPSIIRGLYGDPVNVHTMGGFIAWHYASYFALLVGLWSILALSGTLAGEARRGALEFVLATRHSRRAIATQKIAGHGVAIAASMVALAVTVWLAGAAFGSFPGDAVEPATAAAFVVGVGLRGLLAGAVAFALASVLGRGAAAGIAGTLMVAGYVVNSYRTVVPAFDSIAGISWFSWTSAHNPLAGLYDWPAIGLAAVVCAILLAVGVEAFARRDVGSTARIPAVRLPAAVVGVRGPFGRTLGDLLPPALAWGLGLAAYGVMMAASARPVTEAFATSPAMVEAIRKLLPGMDITTVAGYLQLAFVDFGFVLIGLVAATLIAYRSSDETAGRLELQLATPLSRARWAVTSGLAVGASLLLVTAMLAVSIGAGVAWAGDDPAEPALGTFVLGFYAAALAGVGVAVAGVFRASAAAAVVVALSIGALLVDLLAPALSLPDWVGDLTLTAHLGQPMIGTWDVAGLVACVILAIGGLMLGAWGMSRRDVGT